MTSKANLSNRVEKAKGIANASKILNDDSVGRPDLVEVPGSDGKRYLVSLSRWDSTGIIHVTCRLDGQVEDAQQWSRQAENFVASKALTTSSGKPCKGNRNGTVCYHGFAALLKAAGSSKIKLSFAATEQDAENLNRIKKGKVILLSGEGTGRVWLVISK